MSPTSLTIAQTARALGLTARTVGKWARIEQYQPRAQSARASLLDAYKGLVVRWLDSHPYSAQQIFQRLREQGFTGGLTIVKDYVHSVRPPQREAFLKLAFEPGECAQVDWGEYGSIGVGSTRRRLSFFLMVLCHSRLMYLEFTVLQTMEFFLGCHEHAFQAFHGVPARIMVDNLKSAVLRRAVGEAPVLNPKYQDFARHWGFDISACNVGRGNEKGRVENGVGYVKKNFLAPASSCLTSAPCSPLHSYGWTPWPTCACTAKPTSAPSIGSRKNAPDYGRLTPRDSIWRRCAPYGPPSSFASPWIPTTIRCPRTTPTRA